MHRLEHVGCELANALVDLCHAFAFGAENRISVFHDRQLHFSPRVKAGRFFTPASFNASITLMIMPNDAFLSACKATLDFFVAANSRTATSSSSTGNGRPSSCTSSFASTLTTECSASAGAFCAVCDSGKLICTSG